MDIGKFTQKTGSLVKINFPVEDWAFVPAALPPKWRFPERLWPMLAEAKQCLGELNGIGRMLPNPKLLMNPLSKREALRSSSLEGTYATPEQLLLFELNQKENLQTQADRASDWREVFNHDNTLKLGFNLFQEKPFDLFSLRQLHAELLSGVRGKEKDPGKFRDCQIHIGSDRRFIPPPPHVLDECLNALISYIQSPNSDYDPIVNAFMVHYQFETIHPFMDGNGRLGRVLLSLMISKWCKHHMPWLYMSAYYEKYKDEYFDNLFEISAQGAWDKWIEFCLRGTIEQSKDAIRRCEALVQAKKRFHDMIDGAAPRLHPIIDSLFDNPLVSISRVAQKFKTSYPTAKLDLEKLQATGILAEIPNFRPKTYFASEIMDIAYSET